MRLLHAWPDPVCRGLHPGRARRQRRRDSRIYERQSVPLRRLSAHRRRGEAGQREDGGLMRAFDYVRASDAASAVHLADAGSSYLAGGTTLLDLAKLDVMQPKTVIDINDLRSQFGAIAAGRDGVHLGAFVHMAEAAEHPALRARYPMVAQSL